MATLNPRQDLFRYSLPQQFFDKDIIAKYNAYLARFDYEYDSIDDFVNESIQSITLPSFEYTPIEQQSKGGISAFPVYKPNPQNIQNLPSKTLTVTFRHSDAYITYWLMLEHFFKRYDANEYKHAHFGSMSVQTLSSLGHIVSTMTFEQSLFTGMSELPLSYSNQDRAFDTFTCTFYYSSFNTSFSIPELNLKS